MSFRMRNPCEKVYKKPPSISVQTNKNVTKNVTNNVTVKSSDEKNNDQFSVGDDTVVFDMETGLWKIKK